MDFEFGTTLQSGQTLLSAYGTPSDQTTFLKANNLENKVDPNHVYWYWQTDLTLSDGGGDFALLWEDPTDATNQVVIDAFDYQSADAANVYYDITQPTGTPRPSVLTLRRDLETQINLRQDLYNQYGLADLYYEHLNQRLDQTITQQLAYLNGQNQNGWGFDTEVATGEITTAFYAANNNAYAPHAPEDYTLSPYQWYEAENNSQSSSVEGEVSYNTEAFKYRRERGKTYYELSNHLGNVLVTVTDMKVGIYTDADFFAEYYEATVVSANDYYPFGSAMAGRKYNQGSYRFGFNGQEEDQEWKGGAVVFKYRIHHPIIGRFPTKAVYQM